MMDKRSISTEVPSTEEEMDVDKLLESLETRKNGSVCIPTCISSSATKLRAEGIGTICGRLYIGTTENIPPSELIDTTGAGDAFAGDCSLRYLRQLFNRENAMLCCQCGSCQVQSSRGTKWSSAP
ncbi:unnamed protein product [Lathyrus sativus]|nr:unnamed protein product [Lathyrus sativus]